LRLKIYYELGYDNSFEDLVNSFRRLLTAKNGTIPPHHLQANRDFITIIHKIYKLNFAPSSKAHKIASHIESIEMLPEKAWLLKKLKLKSKA